MYIIDSDDPECKKKLDGYNFKLLPPADPDKNGGNGPPRDEIYDENIKIIKDAANLLNDVNFTIMNTPDVFYLRKLK